MGREGRRQDVLYERGIKEKKKRRKKCGSDTVVIATATVAPPMTSATTWGRAVAAPILDKYVAGEVVHQ